LEDPELLSRLYILCLSIFSSPCILSPGSTKGRCN